MYRIPEDNNNGPAEVQKEWRNRNIKVKDKIPIYNVYLRSILINNSSIWVANKSINAKIDSFYIKQLRTSIREPRIYSNCTTLEETIILHEQRKDV